MKKNSRIGILGTKNAIGKAILKKLKNNKFQNISILDFDYNSQYLQKKIFNFFKIKNPEYLFVCSGEYGGILANRKFPADLMLSNLISSCLILNIAKNFKLKKLIYISSSCIYPSNVDQPLKPNQLLSHYLEETNKYYALAKISGTFLCEAINIQHKKNFISIIPSNYFGPNDLFDLNNSHVISSLIRKFHEAKINKKNSVKVWGSGNAVRDYTYVEDIAGASILIMNKNINRNIINISSGNCYSVRQIAQTIKKIVDYKGKIVFDTSMPDGMKIKTLDNTLIKKIGYKFSDDLKNDLKETYNWYKNIFLKKKIKF